jgi:hypothetical protein
LQTTSSLRAFLYFSKKKNKKKQKKKKTWLVWQQICGVLCLVFLWVGVPTPGMGPIKKYTLAPFFGSQILKLEKGMELEEG